MKEKSVVIVMDENKFKSQENEIYELRKTCIHAYDGDVIKRIQELEQAQMKLNGIRGIIEILSPHSDEQKIQAIKDILDNPDYEGF